MRSLISNKNFETTQIGLGEKDKVINDSYHLSEEFR